MDMALNKKLIGNWVLTCACKHQFNEVMHAVVSIDWLDFSSEDESDFDYQTYAFLRHLIDKIVNKNVLENTELLKSSVTYLENFYVCSKRVPFNLFFQLSIRLKYLTALQVMKKNDTPGELPSLLATFFPVSSLESRHKLQKKYGLRSAQGNQMKSVFDTFDMCRVEIVNYLAHFNAFYENYDTIIQEELEGLVQPMMECLKDIWDLVVDPADYTVLEQVVQGTLKEEEFGNENEVSHVRKILQLKGEISEETLLEILNSITSIQSESYESNGNDDEHYPYEEERDAYVFDNEEDFMRRSKMSTWPGVDSCKKVTEETAEPGVEKIDVDI